MIPFDGYFDEVVKFSQYDVIIETFKTVYCRNAAKKHTFLKPQARTSEIGDINKPIQNTRCDFTEYFIKNRSRTSISLKKEIKYDKYILL